MDGEKKIRVGLLIDSNDIPFWAYEMINELEKSSYALVVLLIIKEKPNTGIQKKSFLKKINYLFYVIYRKLDDIVFGKSEMLSRQNISNIKKIQTVRVKPKTQGIYEIIEENDIQQIQYYNTDILIRIGFGLLKGEILRIPKYGVWSLHHGDNKTNRGGPPGMWELIEKRSSIGMVLQIISDKIDAGIVIDETSSSVDPLSLNRTLNAHYAKSGALILRNIEFLFKFGFEVFSEKINVKNREIQIYSNKFYKSPKNSEFISFFVRFISSLIINRIKYYLFIEQWFLYYKFSRTTDFNFQLYSFKKLIPPKDRFWADPFIVERNEKYYIFLEEFIYKTNKAHISMAVLEKNGFLNPPQPILETNYHLSYPYIFIDDDDKIYMIPESSSIRKIDLYTTLEFPYQWTHVKTLFNDISAVDSTIIRYRNKYWLFTNIRANRNCSSSDELHLFFANDLLGEWHNHPMNPIVSDVRKSRPAGRIFNINNTLYRPTQDCSVRYGYGFKIAQILELSETRYSEKIIEDISPSWDNIIATHTFNFSSKLTIIDGLKRRYKY